jgi:hypothetical protein
MEDTRLEHLLQRIAQTESHELSCSECFELLDIAVELDLAGRTDTPTWRQFAQHLGQCGVCREEYEVLRDFVTDQPESSPPPPIT